MAFLELDGTARELGPETTVGSGSQASWRVPAKDLAARHFTVHLEGDSGAKVVPASPQHIVIINGEPVPPTGTAVKRGDIISAGAAHFIFLAKESDKRPELPAPLGPSFLVDTQNRRAYPLNRRVVQIGREIGCNIVLKDTSVSRFHADIRAEGGQHVLYAMGSTGTKVGSEAVTRPRMLREGDEIRIGRATFTFTRDKVPPAMKVVELEEHADASFARRETVVYQRAITGSHETLAIEKSPIPMVLGVLVLLVGLIAVFTVR
ncbi:MAG TPA: FHA domain-containing protein [Gemmatimonadaceae bacterium]|nr:FHA domain-containing protein [Gemmatimonadaceae bacterium]